MVCLNHHHSIPRIVHVMNVVDLSSIMLSSATNTGHSCTMHIQRFWPLHPIQLMFQLPTLNTQHWCTVASSAYVANIQCSCIVALLAQWLSLTLPILNTRVSHMHNDSSHNQMLRFQYPVFMHHICMIAVTTNLTLEQSAQSEARQMPM